jgi:hypothetical protein
MSKFRYLRSLVGILCIITIAASRALAADVGVCARVVIEIEQELTLEREGFEARLGIVNGLPSALENISITIKFADADGKPVSAVTDGQTDATSRFYYRLQTGYTQPSSVAAGATQQVAYLLVPALGASGTSANGAVYQIGATIKYRVAGQDQTVELAPDTITVRPMPQLQLQYFLPGDVYGDDPMTSSVEPVVPFALCTRIINHSPYATARKVSIQSGQPEIVDNQQGLLIDFRIIGAQVNGGDAQPTLLANFGDVAPLRSSVGNWLMSASLSGRFVKFTAEVAHAPEFGGALTSLIPEDAISTHRLLGQVLVDLPGRDAIPDFLAVDAMTGSIINVKLYESDNDTVSTLVDYYGPESNAAALGSTGAGTYALSVQPASSLLYLRLASPLAADKTVRAVRSDGKVLPSSNAWISKSKNAELEWVYTLNLFDTSKLADQGYTLTFTDPLQSNRAPAVTILGSGTFTTYAGREIAVNVTGVDPDGIIPTLSSGLLPDGAGFTDAKNGTGVLKWTPSLNQVGGYTVQFKASDGFLTDSKSAQIEITALPTVGLLAWQNRYWPGVTDQAIIGSAADPDGDRLDNLLEYALDADPTVPDDSFLPTIGTTGLDANSYLTLTYRQRTDDPGLTYEVVSSDNLFAPLATWTVQTTVLTTTSPSTEPPGIQLVTIRDATPIEAGSAHHYLRLRVSYKESTP